MSATVPWTVVSPAADDSVAATSLPLFMAWLAARSDVALHTVLWASGPNGTAPYDHGRFSDVGAAHEGLVASALRSVGLTRLGGGIAGRAVRASLRTVPRDGVLYLGSVRAGAVLRYLPPGDRTVVTHVHAADRRADPPLPRDRVEALLGATDVWVAVDDDTRDWLVDSWGVAAGSIHVVPEPVDPSSWHRTVRVTDPEQLRLGLRGTTWFRRDHAGRLVQMLLRMRPQLQLELVWADAVSADHLGPLLHDLRQLGLDGRLELSRTTDEVRTLLSDVDVLAFTTPDEDMEWVLSEAGTAGVPMVCFDSHPSHTGVSAARGAVVPYLDIAAMAEAVLAFLDERRSPGDARVLAQREEQRVRDVAVIGPRLLELVGGGGAP